VAAFALEEAGWHGGARAEVGGDDPRSTQSGFKRARAGGNWSGWAKRSLSRVAGGVTFQAGRAVLLKEAARHFGFLRSGMETLLNVGEGCRDRAWKKKTHQKFAQLVFGEREVGMRTCR